MKQIIFILMTLLSFNLSAQKVNKYGEKVISEINIILYNSYDPFNKTIKFTYNDKLQLQSYEVIDNIKNKIIEKTYRDGNKMIVKNFPEEPSDEVTYYFDENNLIVEKTQIGEISSGRIMKLVWHYEYGEPYDNGKPYVVRKIHYPYYKNSNENCYKLYKPDEELWETQYYKGIYANILVSNGNKPYTTEYFEKKLKFRNLENVNDTNYDIVGLLNRNPYLECTEWLCRKNLLFTKNNDLIKLIFEKDKQDNITKITRYWEDNVSIVMTIKYLY